MQRSLIYSHIALYRGAMNLLYAGGYRARFRRLVEVLGPDVTSVCEPCFGDTWIAEWCRTRDIRWTGIDLNPGFCRRARRLGFEAIESDLLESPLPRADAYVMAGSLYHFHERAPEVLLRIFAHTNRFVLSEPIRNLSAGSGPLGCLARRATNPGSGPAAFRYDEPRLLAMLEAQRAHGIGHRVVARDRDLLLEISRVAPAAGSRP